METPPPKWVRRLFIAPLVFVAALVFTIASPVLHLIALVLDLIFDRRRLRLSRFVGVGLAFCVLEVFGLFALMSVTVGSFFGRYMDRPFWRRANLRLAGQYMELSTRAIQFFLGFRFTYSYDPVTPGPQLVFARHAGPGDAYLISRIFLRDIHRPLHAIGAAKLQWDPFLDIVGERLKFHFLLQNPTDTMAELDKVRELAASLGETETLVIFPEGGNFTPGRRRQQLERFIARDRHEYAERAERLQHTLLPKSGGVQAAIAGCPDATVIFAAHAGLDDLHGFDSLWQTVPLGREVTAHGWQVSLDDYPADRAEQARWLFDRWQGVDDWIGEHLAATGIDVAMFGDPEPGGGLDDLDEPDLPPAADPDDDARAASDPADPVGGV